MGSLLKKNCSNMDSMQAGVCATEQPPAPKKPWKQRRSRRSSVENQKPSEIEIFEGRVQGSRLLSALDPTPVQAYTKVRTGDGFLYVVPTVVLKEAEQVKLMLNMDASFKEKLENIVHFEEIRGGVMEVVLRFCFEDLLNKARVEQLYGAGGPRPRLAFHFEVAPALAMEIISAAHFLGLKELLQLASAMVAHNLSDVPDVSTLPKDLASVVAQHLSAEGLLEAEEREDFHAIGLDSPGLWEQHCQSRYWTGVASLGLSEDSDRGEPSLFDAAAPDHWKRVYVTHDLHFASASVTLESFPRFHDRLQRWGKFAAFQVIGQSLYEDVVRYFGRDALVRYASLLPELCRLVLDRIDFQPPRPLEQPVTNRPDTPQNSPRKDVPGSAPDLEALLRALPCLQVFVVKAPTWRHVDNEKASSVSVRGRNLGSVEIRALSRALRDHQRLALLDWSTNPLGKEDFWEILRSLPHSCLKILDLSWCDIPSCSAPLDVLAGLQDSVLESLLLSGNPFGKPQWQQPDAVPVEEGSWRRVNGIWRKTMATPSARRPAKPSPSAKTSPTSANGSVKKKGPVKRPEWNLCFLTEEPDAGSKAADSPGDGEPSGSAGQEGASQSPGDDEPGGSGQREDAGHSPGGVEPGSSERGEGASQSQGDDEPGRLGRGEPASQSPGADEPGRESQAGQSHKKEVLVTPSEGGPESGRNETGEWSVSCSQEDETSCSGTTESGASSPVRPGSQSPVNHEPSASGFEGLNGRRVVERPGGVQLGTVRAENGPTRAQIHAPKKVSEGSREAVPSVGGNAPLGTAYGVTSLADRKGKAKINEKPPAVSAAPLEPPKPSDPANPPPCVAHLKRELEADPLRMMKGKEQVAESAEPPEPESNSLRSIKGKEHVVDLSSHDAAAASRSDEAPTVILGSILTALPTTLKTLALSDCALGDVHVAQIVRGLTSAGSELERLDLSQNEVSARGARGIFTWMQENSSLRELSLAQNKVTSSCIDALAAALRCHVALRKLSLAGNYSFGEERVPDVLEAARDHADLLAAASGGRSIFSLDLSFIDVTHGARNRLRDVYGAYEHLDLQI